jgi:hypothetical protein
MGRSFEWGGPSNGAVLRMRPENRGPVSQQRPVQRKRALAIVRMRSLLNYSEHCRSETSARERLRVLALLNRPLVWHDEDPSLLKGPKSRA